MMRNMPIGLPRVDAQTNGYGVAMGFASPLPKNKKRPVPPQGTLCVEREREREREKDTYTHKVEGVYPLD